MNHGILIVDDEEVIRHTLGDYLEDCGMETRTAANGREGLHAVDERLPDIVDAFFGAIDTIIDVKKGFQD